MPHPQQPSRRWLRTATCAACALLIGAATGYLAGRRDLGPGDLRALGERWLGGSEEEPDGWWGSREPGGDDTEDALSELARLGYVQAYRDAAADAGVLVYEAAACAAGLNLVVSAHASEAVLMDLEGQVLHRWSKGFDELWPEAWDPRGSRGQQWWRNVHLLPGGRLLAIWEAYGLVELDRDSNVIWKKLGGFHHELDVLADGSFWVLTREPRLVPRVHPQKPILEDFLEHLSPQGELLERLSVLEAFERSPYAPLLTDMAREGDVFHTNAITVFEGEFDHLAPIFSAGHALISVRELDVVGVIDLERGALVWALTGLWRRQHDPRLLADGHLLVFDNLGRDGKSRVLEIDPFSQELAWSWDGAELGGLDSALCGLSRRLSNGNTLVTESLAGRAIEVTPEGRLAWVWQSPHRGGETGDQVAVLMQVERVPVERVADWLPD